MLLQMFLSNSLKMKEQHKLAVQHLSVNIHQPTKQLNMCWKMNVLYRVLPFPPRLFKVV